MQVSHLIHFALRFWMISAWSNSSNISFTTQITNMIFWIKIQNEVDLSVFQIFPRTFFPLRNSPLVVPSGLSNKQMNFIKTLEKHYQAIWKLTWVAIRLAYVDTISVDNTRIRGTSEQHVLYEAILASVFFLFLFISFCSAWKALSNQRWNRLRKSKPARTGRFRLSTGPGRPVEKGPGPAKNRWKPVENRHIIVNKWRPKEKFCQLLFCVFHHRFRDLFVLIALNKVSISVYSFDETR